MDKKFLFLSIIAIAALAISGWVLSKTFSMPVNVAKDAVEIKRLQGDLASVKAGLPPTWGGWPANGYMIKVKDGPVIYFTGDTDLMINWDAIREYYHPDIVLATNSVLYQMGINEWVYAINKIKPKYVLASHFGSFAFYPKTDDDFAKTITEKTDAEGIKSPGPGKPVELMGTKITWLGHAAFLIETPGGSRIGIDPEWNAVNINNFPNDFKTAEKYNADLILISHGHFDHFDPAALKILMAPANGRTPYLAMMFELAAYTKKLLPEYTGQILPINMGAWIGRNLLESAYNVKMTNLEDVEFAAIFATHSSGVFSPVN